MRYALLIYTDQSAWLSMSAEETAAARAASIPRWYALFDEIRQADPHAAGVELEDATSARVVRVREGRTIVTDGPFAETKEQIGGLLELDLPDLDEAIRLASLVPAAEYGSLEIRPVLGTAAGPEAA